MSESIDKTKEQLIALNAPPNPKSYFEPLEYQTYVDMHLITPELKQNDAKLQQDKTLKNWVYIAAIPKSGSTYISNKLAAILNYKCCVPFFYSVDFEQNLSPLNFIVLQQNENVVCHTHTPGKYPNAQLLKRYGIKPIVILRDLRDVILSTHDHMFRDELNLPQFGRLSNDWFNLPYDRRIRHLILNFLPNYVNWVETWLKEDAPIFRYEDMHYDSLQFFNAVLNYYDHETVTELPPDHDWETRRFNKGGVGRWNSTMPKEPLPLFYEIAGDTLERMGYSD